MTIRELSKDIYGLRGGGQGGVEWELEKRDVLFLAGILIEHLGQKSNLFEIKTRMVEFKISTKFRR